MKPVILCVDDTPSVLERQKMLLEEKPVALLSGDKCLPLRDLEAVDCFLPKSEPIISFLEKVDYLLSLRFLFCPFAALKAQNAGPA